MKQTIELPIGGMTCGSCVRHVDAALRAVPGVVSQTVDLAGGRAVITFDPSAATVDAVCEAVRGAGFEPGEARDAPPTSG